MPRSTSANWTALARCSDSSWLRAASPVESVWPTILSRHTGKFLSICAMSSNNGSVSGRIVALSTSKWMP